MSFESISSIWQSPPPELGPQSLVGPTRKAWSNPNAPGSNSNNQGIDLKTSSTAIISNPSTPQIGQQNGTAPNSKQQQSSSAAPQQEAAGGSYDPLSPSHPLDPMNSSVTSQSGTPNTQQGVNAAPGLSNTNTSNTSRPTTATNTTHIPSTSSKSSSSGGESVPLPPSAPWTPTGGYDSLSDLSLESIQVVGVGGAANFLNHLFKRYLNAPKGVRSPILAGAFVSAVGHQARRAPNVVRPMLKQLASLEELDEQGQENLAVILSDFSCHQSASILASRSRGSKRSMVYYTALMKACTESAKERLLDVNLAVQLADEMVRQGHKNTPVTTRLLMIGFTRTPYQNLSLNTALNCMTWRLAVSNSNHEPCFAHHFFSVLEMCTGAQVPAVIAYLENTMSRLAPSLERRLLKRVLPHPSMGVGQGLSANCKVPENPDGSCDWAKYFVVDVNSLQMQSIQSPINNQQPGFVLGKDGQLMMSNGNGSTTSMTSSNYTLPPCHYMMFLYSAVRDLCQRASRLGDEHPICQKLAHIRQLVAANPKQCWILSLGEELELRPPTASVQVTPHCRMLSFVQGMFHCKDDNCQVVVVTSDAALEGALQRDGIPPQSIQRYMPPLLPSVPCAPYSRSEEPYVSVAY